MPTNAIALGSTPGTTSSDISVPANGVLSVFIQGAGPYDANVFRKFLDDTWGRVRKLNNKDQSTDIFGEGTYKIIRNAGNCQVDYVISA